MKNNKMKIISFVIGSAAALSAIFMTAQARVQNISIAQIRALYQQQQDAPTLQTARAYQKLHPNDPDSYVYSGLSNYRQKNYDAAIVDFKKVLTLYPNYPEVRKYLLEALVAAGKYNEAISIAQSGQGRENWSYYLAKAYYAKRDYYSAVATLRPMIKVNPDANKLYREINEATGYRFVPHFELGGDLYVMPVNVPNQNWTASDMYASFVNRYGTYSVEVRQAARLGQSGYQYALVAWPIITNNFYLHLAYAHSYIPELFGNNDYLAEAFIDLPHGIEFSGGGAYRSIAITSLTSYWPGLGIYFGKNYFQFSPIFFSPRSGPDSLLYRFKFRHYFSTPDKYIGVVLATGTSPDLADLLTVNFFKTDYTYIMLEGQLSQRGLAMLKYGVGYSWQTFPNGFVRRMWIFNLGTKFRFV